MLLSLILGAAVTAVVFSISKSSERTKEIESIKEDILKTQYEAYKITQRENYKPCTDEEFEALVSKVKDIRKIERLKLLN